MTEAEAEAEEGQRQPHMTHIYSIIVVDCVAQFTLRHASMQTAALISKVGGHTDREGQRDSEGGITRERERGTHTLSRGNNQSTQAKSNHNMNSLSEAAHDTRHWATDLSCFMCVCVCVISQHLMAYMRCAHYVCVS